jgi:signal transduction histidine kinase
VIRLVQHDALIAGVTATFDSAKGLPLIVGDYTQLQQVVLNLARNGIEAMHLRPVRERRLGLATRFDGGNSTVLLSVQDSGSGVAVEPRDRIFEPFFTTKAAGTGLGLSICRTIVEQHGGTLRLASTGPHGSTFEMAIPVQKAS